MLGRFFNINLIALIAVSVAVCELTILVSADEWTDAYNSMFGYLNSASVADVTVTVKRLKNKIDNTKAPEDRKKLVDIWFKVAHEKLNKLMCSDEYAMALKDPHQSSLGLRTHLRNIRRRLTDYCIAEFVIGLDKWHAQESVRFYTYRIAYNGKVHSLEMADRLVTDYNRSLGYLRSNVFDMKASKEENYQRFKQYYDKTSPCKQKPLSDYVRQFPDFIDFFKPVHISSNLDRKMSEIMRRAIACIKINDSEAAKEIAFNKLYAKM